MDFNVDETHEDIRKAVRDMMKPFDDDYWMRQDTAGEFPWEFYHAVAKAGWLGLNIPEEYGGAGLGVTEASIVEQEISAAGGRDERLLRGAHQHLRVRADDQARLGTDEAEIPAARRRRGTCTWPSRSPNPMPAPTRST